MVQDIGILTMANQ